MRGRTPEGTREEPLLELPRFDERTTRRAVWRGIARTALVAAASLFLGLVLLKVVTGVAQRGGDRDDRFELVVGRGLGVANPDYSVSPSGCCNTDLTGMELWLEAVPRTASPVASRLELRPRMGLLGNVDPISVAQLPDTPVRQALNGVRPSKEATRRLVADLPRRVLAVLVVELDRSADASALARLRTRHDLPPFGVPIFLQSPYQPPEQFSGRPERPLAWPEPSIENFQAWARALRGGDDETLEWLFLPPADRIREVADEGRVHALVVERASVAQIERFLADPAVRSVRIADVEFALYEPADS